MKAPEILYYYPDDQGGKGSVGLLPDMSENHREYRLVGQCVWRVTHCNSLLHETGCGELANLLPKGPFCSCGNRIKVVS